MRKKVCLFLVLSLCLLLASCKSSKDGQFQDEPPRPEKISFYVSCVCDLTDAEGRTLHCGSPKDFYGTIEGTNAEYSGTSMRFQVPYSEFYRFTTKSKKPVISAFGGSFSELELDGAAEELEWRPTSWRIKSGGIGATLRFNVDSREKYMAAIELRLDSEAEISMGLRHITLSGLKSEPKISVREYEKGMKTVERSIPIKDGATTVVFDKLENDQLEVIADGKTEQYALTWEKIG